MEEDGEAEVGEDGDVDCTDGRFKLFDVCDCAAANSAAPCNDEGDCCNNWINCACMASPEIKERESTAAAMELNTNNMCIDFNLMLVMWPLIYKCSDINVDVFRCLCHYDRWLNT